MTTDGLRERPLETVGVVVTFGATHASVAVRRTVVGYGRFGKIVPPLTGGTVREERVSVREEGGVCEGFLF